MMERQAFQTFFPFLNFQALEMFPVFPVFPVSLGKKKEENLAKSCSIRTAFARRSPGTSYAMHGWMPSLFLVERHSDTSKCSCPLMVSYLIVCGTLTVFADVCDYPRLPPWQGVHGVSCSIIPQVSQIVLYMPLAGVFHSLRRSYSWAAPLRCTVTSPVFSPHVLSPLLDAGYAFVSKTTVCRCSLSNLPQAEERGGSCSTALSSSSLTLQAPTTWSNCSMPSFTRCTRPTTY